MKKFIALAIVASFAFTFNASAQKALTKMHALYIFNFIKNIQWPAIGDTYVVGVFSNDFTTNEIKRILGFRQFNGKSILVKNITTSTEASDCHIVFVSMSHSTNIKEIRDSSDLNNTLVVSEKGQLNNGAAIAFIIENAKLRFKINEAACTASGLKVSQSLLSFGV